MECYNFWRTSRVYSVYSRMRSVKLIYVKEMRVTYTVFLHLLQVLMYFYLTGT